MHPNKRQLSRDEQLQIIDPQNVAIWLYQLSGDYHAMVLCHLQTLSMEEILVRSLNF